MPNDHQLELAPFHSAHILQIRRPSNIANFDGRKLIEASLEFMSGRFDIDQSE
jgi:hypothetical protein